MTGNVVSPHDPSVSEEEDALSWWEKLAAPMLGSGLGALASSNPMVVAGVAAGFTEAWTRIAREFRKRVLGPWEEKRTAAIIVYTRLAIEQRLTSGAQLRTDSFFAPEETGRSTAEEIAEAIVLAAEREHEERKIRHLGHLYAFIATQENIDPGLANHLVRLAKSLSFRQYCILALPQSTLRGELYRGRTSARQNEISEPRYSALLEYHELYERRLVIFPNVVGVPNLYPNTMTLYEMQLFGIGRLLYEGLRLEDISTIDLGSTVKLLADDTP